MKRIAILQSSYLPWKGTIDLINAVDEFVLLDDVQYTRRDWRNRNKIKTPQGVKWLTVPMVSKGKFDSRIEDMEVSGHDWAEKHFSVLKQNYQKTPFFRDYESRISELYKSAAKETHLSIINHLFLKNVCEWFELKTPITWSRDYGAEGNKEKRLISICQAAKATHYISGPAARDYIPKGAFANEGLVLEYADFSGYPVYNQPYGAFDHFVTALDLLFCTGPKAPDYLISPKRPLGICEEKPGEVEKRIA